MRLIYFIAMSNMALFGAYLFTGLANLTVSDQILESEENKYIENNTS